MQETNINLNELIHSIYAIPNKGYKFVVSEDLIESEITTDIGKIRIVCTPDMVGVYYYEGGKETKSQYFEFKNQQEFLEICQKLRTIVQ